MDSRRPGDEVSLAYHPLVSLLQEELRDYPADDPGPLRLKEKNERVAALTKNVEQMNGHLIRMQMESDAALRKHSASLRQEQQIREKEEKEIRKLLEDAETGGLDISFIGLIWLTVGLALSTVSPEIAQWMR